MNKKNSILFIIVLALVMFLKYPYLNEIGQDSEFAFYHLLITFSKNNLVNFIWFIPILFNIFVISKDIYYKLVSFDARYHNRNRYWNAKMKENIVQHFLICCITILGQWILFVIFSEVEITINGLLIIFFLKYFVELYLTSIIILVISLLIHNYIYAFIIVLITILLFISSAKLFYIPFVSLYVGYNLNIFNILILIGLIILTRKIYRKLDLGGVQNEIDR